MRNVYILLGLLLNVQFFAANSNPFSNVSKQKLKVSFTENKGQMTDMDGKPVPFVLFKIEGPGINVFLTETGLTYMFLKSEEEEEFENDEINNPNRFKYEWNRVDLILKGANIKKENVIKEGESIYFKQYFLGHCPNGINVHEYGKITIVNIYPGIDWVLYNSNEKGFKYDFIVHPNANPNDIELVYNSKKAIQINSNGDIEIKTEIASIKENHPISFLNNDEIETQFVLKYQKKVEINGEKGYETAVQFGFLNLQVLNRTSDLTIDPILTWATLYGGNFLDGAMSAATDFAGNVYTTGYTSSSNFPVASVGNFFQGTNWGGSDIFIMKYSITGVLLWSTYYGGLGLDNPNSITTDGNGSVFVTGWTESNNFPTQNSGNYFVGSYSGGRDAYILKFSSTAIRLWATYYGGSSGDDGNSISVDNNGNIFVTGATASSNFPVQNAGSFFQGTLSGNNDVFILKFTNSGARLWATLYGGSNIEASYSVTTDLNGNVIVTGITRSNNFPVQNSGAFFQGNYAGNRDLFIIKFSNSGVRLWATYYGGSSFEGGFTNDEGSCSVATDGFGNVYVTGITNSSDFPVLNGGNFFQSSNGGGQDAYILKFDNLGNRIWASYYGGSSNEVFWTNDNITIDPCNNVYISFGTNSSNLTTQNCSSCYFDGTANGTDNFLVMFNNTGVLLWATYFGGPGNMAIRQALASDSSGNLYVTGEWKGTNLSTLPFTNPGNGSYFVNTALGTDDSFIARFLTPCNCSVTAAATASCTPNGPKISLSLVATSYYTIVPNYYWMGPNSFTSSAQSPTLTNGGYGIYSLTVNWPGCSATSTIQAVAPSSFSPVITNTPVSCFGSADGKAIVSSIPGISTAPYTYSWSSTLTQTTALAISLSSGNYICFVTDSKGCTYQGTTAIIQPPPLPVVISSDKLKKCEGQPFYLTAHGAASYSWQPNVSISNTIGATCTVTPTLIQTYTVFGAQNSCTASAVITLTVGPPPNVTLIIDKPIICNGSVAKISAYGASNYTWFPSNSIDNSYANFIVANPVVSTIYTVFTSNNYCVSTKTIYVEVVASPTLNISSSNQKICQGNTTFLYASGAQHYNFIPIVPNNLITPSSASVIPNATTNYSITGYNTSGTVSCSVTKEILIEVVPQVTAAVSRDVVICEGDGIKLNAQGGDTYVWTPSNGLNNHLISTPYANPKTSTIYSVNVSKGGNCGQTNTVMVTVNSNPIVYAGEDKVFNADEPMFLNAVGTGTLTWVFGEGVYCKSCPNTQIFPKGNTCFQIEAVNKFGCKAIDEVCIEVTYNDNIYIPNTFTPNDDGLNDVFKVYGNGITKIQMLIYDRWGQKLFESSDNTEAWDGTYQEELCKNDLYTYMVTYVGLNGKIFTRSGHVSLLK